MAQQAGVFEIAHDFMAIEDRIDVAQGGVEKWREIVFLFAGGDRRDDLIEVQVGEEVGRGERFAARAAFRAFKQYAGNVMRNAAVRSAPSPSTNRMRRPYRTTTIEIGVKASVLTTRATPRRTPLAPRTILRRRNARFQSLRV